MNSRGTRPKTKEKYEKAKSLIEKDKITVGAACARSGISECWFWKLKKDEKNKVV